MTTYLITHWVRDRRRGARISLELALRRLTRDPAEFYGLGDRGTIGPGMRADLNVIDFERLRLRYPERETDLPAGAGRLVQRWDGYVATMVAGELVDDDVLTEARPGRLIRSKEGA